MAGKKFDNDAAVQVAEEAFKAGFEACWNSLMVKELSFGGMESERRRDEAWGEFEPSESIKELVQ